MSKHAQLTIVVDHAVAVDVRFLNHIFDFLLGQLLAQVGHHATELGRRDHAVVVLVEHPVGASGEKLVSIQKHQLRAYFNGIQGGESFLIESSKAQSESESKSGSLIPANEAD